MLSSTADIQSADLHEGDTRPMRSLRPRRVRVPAFDPETGEITLRDANALIKHQPVRNDAFVAAYLPVA